MSGRGVADCPVAAGSGLEWRTRIAEPNDIALNLSVQPSVNEVGVCTLAKRLPRMDASMRQRSQSNKLSRIGLGELGAGVAVRRTSLFLPDDLSLSTWRNIGDVIVSFSDSSAWWIGDWLVFGQSIYGDRYKRAMAETSLDYQTLRNYAWIARRFEPSRRREKLTFQHHVEVAALDPQEQDHWLDLATNFHWSRNELRRQIRNSGSSGHRDRRPRESQVLIQTGEDRLRRWEAEAQRNDLALLDWIAMVLDDAVTNESVASDSAGNKRASNVPGARQPKSRLGA